MKNITLLNRFETLIFHKTKDFINKEIIIKAIAIFCFINVIMILPDITFLYGSNSIIQESVNDQHIRWYQPVFNWFSNPLYALGVPKDVTIIIFIMIYITSFIGLFLNKFRFISSIIAWFIHLIIVNSNFLFTYGADNMITVLLIFNMLICIPFKNQAKSNATFSFAIRFLQIHMCFIYFFGGLGKVLGTNWLDGNAIWYVINIYSNNYVDLAMNFINYPIVFKLTCWSIVFLELLYPFLIYVPKIKKIVLVKIILLHLFIGIFMNLFTFAGVMILLNLIAFGHYLNWFKVKENNSELVVAFDTIQSN